MGSVKLFNHAAINRLLKRNGPCCVDVDDKSVIPMSNIEMDGYCDMYLTFIPIGEYYGLSMLVDSSVFDSNKKVELFFPRNGTRVNLKDFIIESKKVDTKELLGIKD